MRLLVTGSRHWIERWVLYLHLDALAPQPVILGHGAAPGADRLARSWAVDRGIEQVPYPADWLPGGRFDRAAGHKRNKLMLAQFEPDLVFAFKDTFDWSLKSGGTEHMVSLALKAKVPVLVATGPGQPTPLPRVRQLGFI